MKIFHRWSYDTSSGNVIISFTSVIQTSYFEHLCNQVIFLRQKKQHNTYRIVILFYFSSQEHVFLTLTPNIETGIWKTGQLFGL